MAAKKSKRPPSSYHYDQASRVNQPTAEMAGLMPDEQRKPQEFILEPRDDTVAVEEASTDRSREPQPRLAWERQGRTSAVDGAHTFAGVPLYTREKVNPLTMIEQLRNQEPAQHVGERPRQGR